jgi:hypothetical protein
LQHPLLAAHESLHGHRVQNFVGDEHTPMPLRHRVDPGYPASQFRQALRNQRLLALSQVRRDLENQVLVRQRFELHQALEHVDGQLATAGPILEYRTRIDLPQHLGTLAGQNATEDSRDFWRRDKVALLAKFCRTRRVVAETRCIQRVMHVLGKADAAARRGNMLANVRSRALAVCGAVGVWRGQRWRQVLLHVNIVR